MILEIRIDLMPVALLLSMTPRLACMDEQHRESCVIRVAGRTIAIWQNPVRVLREQSIVHLALKLHVSGDFSGET